MLVLLTGLAQAEVYKSINERGEVVYSDTQTPGSERVRLAPLPTYKPPPIPASKPAGKAAPVSSIYEAFTFLNPKNESTVRNNLGIVQVQLTLSPSLDYKSDHRIQYYLDGKRHGPLVDKTAITMSNIDRGSHTLSASVFDGEGQELTSTETITIHVKRQSSLQGQDTVEDFDPPVIQPVPGEPGEGEVTNPNILTDNPNLRTRNPNIRNPNPNVRSPNPNVISPPPAPPGN